MFDQGEILLIPVPFSNLSSVKKRPVLVLSNNAHNSSSPDIIVIAITSNLAQKGIEISDNSLTDGFLPKKSIIKRNQKSQIAFQYDKIISFQRRGFRRKISPSNASTGQPEGALRGSKTFLRETPCTPWLNSFLIFKCKFASLSHKKN